MRAVSLILAFAFVVGGTFLTDSAAPELPGVGTFDYSGPNAALPLVTVLAAR